MNGAENLYSVVPLHCDEPDEVLWWLPGDKRSGAKRYGSGATGRKPLCKGGNMFVRRVCGVAVVSV